MWTIKPQNWRGFSVPVKVVAWICHERDDGTKLFYRNRNPFARVVLTNGRVDLTVRFGGGEFTLIQPDREVFRNVASFGYREVPMDAEKDVVAGESEDFASKDDLIRKLTGFAGASLAEHVAFLLVNELGYLEDE